jgi:hypothetical protein
VEYVTHHPESVDLRTLAVGRAYGTDERQRSSTAGAAQPRHNHGVMSCEWYSHGRPGIAIVVFALFRHYQEVRTAVKRQETHIVCDMRFRGGSIPLRGGHNR